MLKVFVFLFSIFIFSPGHSMAETWSPQEVTCLALNVYHEARGEGYQGMVAVAHVTINRKNHKNFPDTLCGVVQQGGEQRRHKCQFSWWCDGLSDKITNQPSWYDALAVTYFVLYNKPVDITHGSLFYHARHVNPYWADKFIVMADIGNHRFYTPD